MGLWSPAALQPGGFLPGQFLRPPFPEHAPPTLAAPRGSSPRLLNRLRPRAGRDRDRLPHPGGRGAEQARVPGLREGGKG